MCYVGINSRDGESPCEILERHIMLILPLTILFIITGIFLAVVVVLFTVIKVSNNKLNKKAAADYAAVKKVYDTVKADPKRKNDYISVPYEPTKLDVADHEGSFFLAIASFGAGLALFISIIALVPFNPKYWTITDQAGTVTSVKTLTVVTDSDDAQLSANFVVTLDDKQQVIMDDPRVQNVKVGDNVDLKCTWEWVYAGKDKQNCQFAE